MPRPTTLRAEHNGWTVSVEKLDGTAERVLLVISGPDHAEAFIGTPEELYRRMNREPE